jgi:pimeloyl-ACP methyl ester carboxylesterase
MGDGSLHFDSDGVRIAYRDGGDGPPIVLVHGFAASIRDNWERMGWIRKLERDGRRVIALDCRGHGESDKPHDPEAYAGDRMALDVIRLLDHAGVSRADLMGYSMGSQIALQLLTRFPGRFRSAVLGGVGRGVMQDPRDRNETIAAGMEAVDGGRVEDPGARAFRAFAEQRGNDRVALAAVMRGRRDAVTPGDLASIAVPVLVIVGGDDTLIGDPRPLAAAIPGAELEVIPDRDHLSAVNHHRYKEAVLAFLARHSPVAGDRFV